MRTPILVSWNASAERQREDTEEGYFLPYFSSKVPEEPMQWRCNLNVEPGSDVFLVRRGKNVVNSGVMGWGTVVSAKNDDKFIGIDWKVLLNWQSERCIGFDELERIDRNERWEFLHNAPRYFSDDANAEKLIARLSTLRPLSADDASIAAGLASNFCLATDQVANAIRKIRLQQSAFRSSLDARYGNKCVVTGVALREMLIASHIVPFSEANDDLKSNPDNGLLLSRNYDAAFDRYLITFTDEGKLLVASRLRPYIAALGIKADVEFTQSARTAMPFETWRLLRAHRNRFEELDLPASNK